MTLASHERPSIRQRSPARVVVAEDDAELRSLLVAELTRSGFDVTPAHDGEAVLDVLRRAVEEGSPVPDVFVMDVRMPNATGYDVLCRLRTAGWAQPVVLMTGFGDPDLHRSAAAEGAAVVLDKPFDAEDLTEIVRLVAMRFTAETQS